MKTLGWLQSISLQCILCDALLCECCDTFNCPVWYCTLSLRYACIRRSGIILTPRLPLCQFFFLSQPPLLSYPTEKNRILSHSPSLFAALETEAFALENKSSGIILIQFVPNFVSFAASIAELTHGEKSCAQSLTHSPSFDALGNRSAKYWQLP